MNCIKILFSGILLLAVLSNGADAGSGAGAGQGAKKPDQRQAPKKVERLNARQQGDVVALRWQGIKGDCDGYRIYHEAGDSLQPGSNWFDIDASQTSSLFSDVTTGGQYTFSVSALYGKKEGPLSASVTVRMMDKESAGPRDTAR